MTGIFPATSMPDRDWWEALWPEPSALLLSLGVGPWMTVLDLCCGDGYFTAPLAKIVSGRVYALDLDPTMIEAAKAEAMRQGVSVLKWIVGDAGEVVKLVPEKVDFVLIANTFHGVPDQPALVKTVARTLRPHGLVALVNWHQRPREYTTVLGQPRGPRTDMRMSPEAARAVLEAIGFRLVSMVDVQPYHYGAVFEHKDDTEISANSEAAAASKTPQAAAVHRRRELECKQGRPQKSNRVTPSAAGDFAIKRLRTDTYFTGQR